MDKDQIARMKWLDHKGQAEISYKERIKAEAPKTSDELVRVIAAHKAEIEKLKQVRLAKMADVQIAKDGRKPYLVAIEEAQQALSKYDQEIGTREWAVEIVRKSMSSEAHGLQWATVELAHGRRPQDD